MQRVSSSLRGAHGTAVQRCSLRSDVHIVTLHFSGTFRRRSPSPAPMERLAPQRFLHCSMLGSCGQLTLSLPTLVNSS
jgi:hypothetical protein